MAPLVSVVLPTHNRRETLPRAIQSVLDQTLDDLELLVVDDASDDGTDALVDEIDDARVRYLRLDKQGGPGRARNAGIGAASGEFIAFQDSDDEWLPLKLEQQLAILREHDDIEGVGGGYIVCAPAGALLYEFDCLSRGRDYERELLEGSCCITPVWLLRRDLLARSGLFDESLPSLEDWDLMLRLSTMTRLQCVREPVLRKHGAPGSLGWDIERRTPAMVELLERHGDRWARMRRLHAEYCLELAYLQLLIGRRSLSLTFVGRAIRTGGVRPKIAFSFLSACMGALLRRRRTPLSGLSRDRHVRAAV